MAKKHTLAHLFSQIFPDEPSNYRGNPSVLTSLANLGHYKESLRLGLEMGLEVNLEGVIKHGKLRNPPKMAVFYSWEDHTVYTSTIFAAMFDDDFCIQKNWMVN